MAKRINTALAALVLSVPFALGDKIPAPPNGGAAERVEPGAATEAATGSVELLESRLIGENVEQHIAILRTRMGVIRREQGPFGLFQDTSKASEKMFELPEETLEEQVVEAAFGDVVKAISISATSPAEQEFLVQGRTIRTGDTFPLVVGNERIEVEVMSVHRASVAFKNIKTGQRAVNRLDQLPPGVSPAHGGDLNVPGVVPAGRSSHEALHVDLSSSPTSHPTRSP